MPVRIGWQPGCELWLLASRSISTGEIAYYVCCGQLSGRHRDGVNHGDELRRLQIRQVRPEY
ncbi:hypothetical protein TPA0908_38960 [Micromonospora sp. AKA38]|nr:hypothetical protein TPA0908_38960 [Micromonospora sp. AKA38]